jgi:hypothetical protein
VYISAAGWDIDTLITGQCKGKYTNSSNGSRFEISAPFWYQYTSSNDRLTFYSVMQMSNYYVWFTVWYTKTTDPEIQYSYI